MPRGSRGLVVLLAGIFTLVIPALAQTQVTFYSAFEDGLDAERQGRWRAALGAFQRAAQLHPTPSPAVFTYGNNRLMAYYPYAHMARCQAELGDWKSAAAHLRESEVKGEPATLRESLARRLKEAGPKVSPARDPEAEPQPGPKESPKETPAPPSPTEIPLSSPPHREPVVIPAVIPPFQEPPEKAVPAPIPATPSATLAPATASQESPSPPPVSNPAAPKPLPHWLWILPPVLLLGGVGGFYLRRRRRPRDEDTQPFSIHPTSLGPYRIERLLGRGGFANTYLATHAKSGEAVAIKVLHTHRWDDEEMLTRFRQEAKVGAMLKHPNIVPILDAFPGGTSLSDPPWIAMAYVEGETLDAHMKAQGALPIQECLAITMDLAEALAHAHTFGVVHRDLKPANVMLQKGRALVMDLGIARVLDSATVTSTYSFLGTPGYAAPEAQKRTHVGPAADRYALGIILFEMLTGTPPFTGETPFDVLDRHCAHPLPELRFLRKDAPQALVRLVERLAQKDPDLRPEDLEVVKILKELQQPG